MKLSFRPAVATVAAAAVIVVGTDLVTYAATGGSLLLGKANSASQTTSVTNTGRGPALSLKNGKLAPPLKVTSTKKVAKLNVDLLDGKDSSVLEPGLVRTTIGTNGAELPAIAFRQITLPSGWYDLTLSGIFNDTVVGSPWPFLSCLIFDSRLLSGGPLNADYLELGATHDLEFGQAGLFTSTVAFIAPGATIVYGCTSGVEGDPSTITAVKAPQFTFRQVPAPTNRAGSAYTPPARQLARLSGH